MMEYDGPVVMSADTQFYYTGFGMGGMACGISRSTEKRDVARSAAAFSAISDMALYESNNTVES